jgi:trehalose-phosphatase
MSTIEQCVDALARANILLVACDFDGTIAPIVTDPAAARPDPRALLALKTLAALPQTHVAIISGRSLDALARISDAAFGAIHLVGSHGSEFDAGFASHLPGEALALREHLRAELAAIARSADGFFLEEKPAAFAFHYRRADTGAAEQALRAIRAGPAGRPGVFTREGKQVIELSVVETNKGIALDGLRRRFGASRALYLGDDTTDEDAFASLSVADVGVKIGEGASRAAYRLGDCTEAARLLAGLAEQRSAWLAGADAPPIDSHALLSDQRTICLLTPSGRITWLCLPRIDSVAIFAELLGGPVAGYFEVRPADQSSAVRQEYDGDSFVLRSVWRGMVVTDYFDCAAGRAYQRAGRSDLLRVIEGRGRVRVTFAPRMDFGRIDTRLQARTEGIEVAGTSDPTILVSPGFHWRIEAEGPHQNAVAEVDLPDQPMVLELRHGTASFAPHPMPEPARREHTRQFWSGWCRTLQVPSIAADLVRRSALVIKALTYGPTAAIAAAATTSLPEWPGGERNWDYRYCWPRDAAMAAGALVRLGNTGQAMKLLDWILGVVEHCESPDQLSPVYTVSGGHLGVEGEISVLRGYAGSRPVRVGNAAAQQVQLDVFGAIVDLLGLLADRGAPLSTEHWRLLVLMVQAVESRWRQPDHGLWEPRIPRRHHLHSRVMCWLTLDRAIRIARYLGRRCDGWPELRQTIAEDVLAHGFRGEINAFSSAYDVAEADAATLWVGLSGMLPPDDPRFLGTIDLVERELRTGPGVYRYHYDDGLTGPEGAFNLCTAWFIEALALAGRRAEAETLLEKYVNLAGPTGLMAEQVDPAGGRALGNYPQAYSHLGLINAAVRLAHG